MRLNRYGSVVAFLATAGPWLTEREAEHNLILGIAGTARDHPELFGTPYLAAVSGDADRFVAAVLRTPPWNVILSEVDDPRALDLVVADLREADLPGVVGPPDAALAFAERWVQAHGGQARTAMEERVFQLTEVIQPEPIAGSLRLATRGERPLLVDWITAFGREALGEQDASRVGASVDDWLDGKGRLLWLWDDNGPKSLTGVGGLTPHGIRIGPVYTPPEERRKGYASALVAAISQAQLDAGRRFCFLYTDLANPTSNKIYQAIGYRPVTDALRIDFHS
jgi:predicted GNAT family acetyltransferase